jgi:hypothetical protein
MDEKWKVVTETLNDLGFALDKTERLEVPGGWLYRTWKSGFSGTGEPDRPDIIAMVFVPAVEDER